MVDKELAVKLRQQGLTYNEIVAHLNCSFGWCAKNLADVKKGGDGVSRVKVDATKDAAVAILKDALARLECL